MAYSRRPDSMFSPSAHSATTTNDVAIALALTNKFINLLNDVEMTVEERLALALELASFTIPNTSYDAIRFLMNHGTIVQMQTVNYILETLLISTKSGVYHNNQPPIAATSATHSVGNSRNTVFGQHPSLAPTATDNTDDANKEYHPSLLHQL